MIKPLLDRVCWFFAFAMACVSCAAPTITPAPTLTVWEKDYPLALNNRWVFQAMRYESVPTTELVTTSFVITETIVEIKNAPPYYAARIHREFNAETPIYVSPGMQDFTPYPAASDDYWLVVNGNRIYRQDSTLDLPNLASTGTLKLVFPLELDAKWYEADEMNQLFPDKKNESMLHRVTRAGRMNAPASNLGSFDNCFLIEETIGGETIEDWFCPGVGFVERKGIHHGTPFGSRWMLIKYQVK